ncbi:hypothetical protein ABMA28_003293 [Loxostege sticticalis]|uniref:Mutator-like transposase domain-containing protein n=1 Tax=Loxostege sticticalis TaxID=481309 RepID=A0ABD0T008_LOXSC
MNAAAQKEREIAIAEGRVDENGIPKIDVIVDGCWCKRIYKKNYSALRSGWLRLILREDLLNKKHSSYSICQHHFSENDVLPGSRRKNLKKNSNSNCKFT